MRNKILGAILMLGCMACAPPDDPAPKAEPEQNVRPVPAVTHDMQELFERSQTRWDAQNIRDYQFTFRRRVTGSTESTGPIVITISDGAITRARSAVGGSLGQVDPKKENLYGIDSLFAYLGQLMAQDVDSLVIRYDAEFGFPYFAYVDDQDREHTTAATTLEVSNFFLLAREAPADSTQMAD